MKRSTSWTARWRVRLYECVPSARKMPVNRPFDVFALLVAAAGAAAAADHVVILGFDGMSPDGIQKAETPILHDLI